MLTSVYPVQKWAPCESLGVGAHGGAGDGIGSGAAAAEDEGVPAVASPDDDGARPAEPLEPQSVAGGG